MGESVYAVCRDAPRRKSVKDVRIVLLILTTIALALVEVGRARSFNVEPAHAHAPPNDVHVETHQRGRFIDIVSIKNVRSKGRTKRVVVSSTTLPRSGADGYVPFTRPIDLSAIVFMTAGFVAAMFATLCGANISAENNGHLPIAWAQPISRSRYLLRMYAIDTAGVAVALLIASVSLAIVVPDVAFTATLQMRISFANLLTDLRTGLMNASPAVVLQSVAFPLAWLGIVTALSASLRVRAGIAIAAAWPLAVLLAAAQNVHSVVQPFLHVLNAVNPLGYYHIVNATISPREPLFSRNTAAGVLPLFAIAMLGMLVAGWQWRRLEL